MAKALVVGGEGFVGVEVVRQLRARGDEVCIFDRAAVEVYRSDTRELARLYPEWGWSYRREIEHFVGCIASGQPFRSPATDAAVDVRIFEEIFRRITGVD